ncbi:DNA-3-methyladenine glycosylase [bacterium]|nr:DNA-3-methyladenine glycosylase [bacterium]
MGNSKNIKSKSLIEQFEHIPIQELLRHAKPHGRSFYERDARKVTRGLLGSLLIRELDSATLAGFIVEAEAYKQNEESCHAHRGKTKRTKVMFGPGGRSYIYFVYGMYWCLNATAENEGIGSACLIRAVEPVAGIDMMKINRGRENILDLCSGPGKLTVAYGLNKEHNDHDLSKPPLRILALPDDMKPHFKIRKSSRIGINAAKELQYRYYIHGNPHVSK